MKTYDFTIPPLHLRVGAPKAKVAGEAENGWEAYAAWLQQLREQVSERRAPVPPDLIP
jgi:hypothetical protein